MVPNELHILYALLHVLLVIDNSVMKDTKITFDAIYWYMGNLTIHLHILFTLFRRI